MYARLHSFVKVFFYECWCAHFWEVLRGVTTFGTVFTFAGVTTFGTVLSLLVFFGTVFTFAGVTTFGTIFTIAGVTTYAYLWSLFAL